MTKICSKCKLEKSTNEFYTLNLTGRFRSQCKQCMSDKGKELHNSRIEIILTTGSRAWLSDEDESTKICSSCSLTKKASEFEEDSRSKKSGNRLRDSCIECNRGTHCVQCGAEKRLKGYRICRECKNFNAKWNAQKGRIETPEQYKIRFKEQKGLCAICRQPEVFLRNGEPILLAEDHDHKTGFVRGLLCGNCNRALGQFQDSEEILVSAIEYLRKAQNG